MTVIVGRILLPCRRFVKAGYVGVFFRRGFSQQGGGARVPAVVSPAWLHEQQQYPANKLRILDVTAFSADEGKNAYEEYKKAHVPGAVFYDLFCNVPPSKLFPKPVPDEAAFVKYARSCGVNTSSHVVLYDNTGETYYRPSRGWWLFRLFGHQSVSVLNGGLQQWISEGFQVSNTIMQVEEGDFEANYQPQLIKSFSDVKENISSKQATHVDCRSYKNHIGDPEDESTGHIPGTIHLHYKPLVNQDTTTLKDVEQLQNIFNEAGIDLQGPVVFSCNRGMAACTELLAAEMCGAVDASVYAGSFTEWKQKAGKELIIQGDELERK